VREFTPLRAGTVSIYVCGATVQAPPHLGHLRGAVDFDILRRWLAQNAFDVTFIRNVTDIDDKILRKAAAAGQPWWAWAAAQERHFRTAYEALGCLPPTHEPRATGHMTEMIELTHRLINSGHAYAAGGDVYFSVRSFPEYGSLSGHDVDATASRGDGEGRKRDLRDFALWKGWKPDEPGTASWPTPWGRARPGWHLECSTMSTRYLGAAFDIHGGGRDLMFPHHDNEIAQSHAAGDAFARYWVHNAWLTVSGEKMSKSLDNSAFVDEVLTRWRPVAVRYYLGAAHYRSTLEFSPSALDEATAAYERIEHFVRRASAWVGDRVPRQSRVLPGAFVTAMDNDLGVPDALSVIHSTVRRGNGALEASDEEVTQAALNDVRQMTGILGIDPLKWDDRGGSRFDEVVGALVVVALEQRAAARVRGDFAAADAIRHRLAEIGVTVQDSPAGSRWEFR
jgi:cysteinyl-tRNA synthetase